MPGASRSTVRVTHVNANWAAGTDGGNGTFELLVVTEDEQRHTLTPSSAETAGLLAMIRISPVLLWDPENRTLIGANILGDWLPSDWSARRPA